MPLLPELVEILRTHLGGRAAGPVFVRRTRHSKATNQGVTAAGLARELERLVAVGGASSEGPVGRDSRLRLAKAVWWSAGAVREDRVRLEFIRAAEAAGLAGQTAPKVLRHQFATALQEGRVDPLVRNLLMGHAAAGERSAGHGLGMTAVYTHTRPETVREQLFAALSHRPAVAAARAWLSGRMVE